MYKYCAATLYLYLLFVASFLTMTSACSITISRKMTLVTPVVYFLTGTMVSFDFWRYQRLVFRHKLYQLREERDMKPQTFASLVSAVLYEKRLVECTCFLTCVYYCFIVFVIDSRLESRGCSPEFKASLDQSYSRASSLWLLFLDWCNPKDGVCDCFFVCVCNTINGTVDRLT